MHCSVPVAAAVTWLDSDSSPGNSELETRKGLDGVVIKATEADKIVQREAGSRIEGASGGGSLACETKC